MKKKINHFCLAFGILHSLCSPCFLAICLTFWNLTSRSKERRAIQTKSVKVGLYVPMLHNIKYATKCKSHWQPKLVDLLMTQFTTFMDIRPLCLSTQRGAVKTDSKLSWVLTDARNSAWKKKNHKLILFFVLGKSSKRVIKVSYHTLRRRRISNSVNLASTS